MEEAAVVRAEVTWKRPVSARWRNQDWKRGPCPRSPRASALPAAPLRWGVFQSTQDLGQVRQCRVTSSRVAVTGSHGFQPTARPVSSSAWPPPGRAPRV